MLCYQLESLPLTERFARVRILERIELETPQIIYLLACERCTSIHSLEFSNLEGEAAFFGNVIGPQPDPIQTSASLKTTERQIYFDNEVTA